MISHETAGHSFQITVKPNGRTFSVQPNETILAAGIRQGINLLYGCKDGACGVCKCKKISGNVTHLEHQSHALSSEEEALGMVLSCCALAHSDVVLESRQVTTDGAFHVKKIPLRVISFKKVSADVMVLKLQMPAYDTFPYHAGQYLDVLLPNGVRRSYSMAHASHTLEGFLELHIRHTPNGKFSDYVFNIMKENDILRIEGPYGSFYLRENSTKPMIFMASGTGFAPIRALMEHLQFTNITRPVSLYWGGCRPADLYQDAWVKERLLDMPCLRYVPVVSNALPEDGWTGRTGFVHLAVLEDVPDLSSHQVYACGAPVVVDSARTDYIRAGLPEDEFFADAFTPNRS